MVEKRREEDEGIKGRKGKREGLRIRRRESEWKA